MGNLQCSVENAALLASIARDVCPFPVYNPSPYLENMLSLKSSLHLTNHYAAVQSSLTPKQLEDFTQGLRTTFGRQRRVTLGGVGVVALSLAIFFDTLAKHVKGEYVPESGPIPNLFVKDPRGYYPPTVHTASEYLRLVPHIANNPTRMIEETESYLKQLKTDKRKLEENKKWRRDDIIATNKAVALLLEFNMMFHLSRITNSTNDVEDSDTMRGQQASQNPSRTGADASHVGKSRKRRIAGPENIVDFSFNCDPEPASRVFLAEVQKSKDTREALEECERRNGMLPKTWLHNSASMVWMDFVNSPLFDFDRRRDELIAQREDFDL